MTGASNKPRVRLYVVGQATYRLLTPVKGWRGPYGQSWTGAKWICIDCGRKVVGDNDKPFVRLTAYTDYEGRRVESGDPCARNGHAPCAWCGKKLPRTNDGCPRAHSWRICPGKTEGHRMIPQHAAAGHVGRNNP